MLSRLLRARLARNLLFVYVLQISNYLLSFVTLPYLTRVLDIEGFGALSYCMGVNAYLWMLMEWGFGVGAVRKVASCREDGAALRAAFWTTLSAKALLVGPALLLLLVLAFVGNANHPGIVIASGLLTIAGGALAADWFVQGVERMGLYLVTSVSARLATLALTLVLVRDPDDMWIAALLHGFVGLAAGAAGFAVVALLYRMGAPSLRLRAGWREMLEFRHFFVARTTTLLYVGAAPLVLGIVSTAAQLGIFAGADKIARIVVTLVGPLGLVAAPRIFATMNTSREKAASLSGLLLIVQIAVTVPASLLLYSLAGPICQVILGPQFGAAADLVRLLAPAPFLMGLSSALANQFLAPLGRERAVSRVTLATSLVYVACLFGLGALYGAAGTACSLLIAETMLILCFAGILLAREKAFLTAAFAARL